MAADDAPRRASEVAPRSVTWVMPGRIPRRRLSEIVGDAGAGKSLLGSCLAGLASNGDALFGDQPMRVLINTLEDDVASTLRPRLEAAGADLERVDIDSLDLRFPRDLVRLEVILSRRKLAGEPLDLVILDSAIAHVPRYVQAEAASEALEGLQRLAENFDCAIVLIHHLSVKTGRTVWTSFGGAYALRRVPRTIHLFGDEPGPTLMERLFHGSTEDSPADRRRSVLVPLKMNIASIPPGLAFSWDVVTLPHQSEVLPVLIPAGETPYGAEEVFQRARTNEAGDADGETLIEQAEVFVIETLSAEGPMPVLRFNELGKAAGLSLRTVERARARVKVEAIPPVRLKDVLPDRFDDMTDVERRGWWVRMPHTPDAVPEDS